ncbi:MAG TPA: peptidase [Oceanospirillaceae bacterium]|nr:peptidase [Oceanospirillaceae bacterium]
MSYTIRAILCTTVLAAAITGCNNANINTNTEVTAIGVIDNYANIALATYQDSLTQAQILDKNITQLIADPTEARLTATKAAWLAARVPYQQSEAFRFGNAVVDDWEGKVNAWPLDEGLIDYVDASYGSESDNNALYRANVINSSQIHVNGELIDVSNITPDLIANQLHEADEVEANVASGYHAIEFLLWGQDLNGTAAGAGNRPASDYDTNNCSNTNCARRGEYLQAASQLLINDLEDMVAAWQASGEARTALTATSSDQGIAAMVTGMGSLSYGELAGERIKLGLMLHDPEEEHDCFSDNTHNSHYYDAKSIQNVYLGEYTRTDGSKVTGPSLAHLVAAQSPQLDQRMQAALRFTMGQMQVMVDRAETVERYDQMIGSNNPQGNQIVQNVVDSLTAQTAVIEELIPAFALNQMAFEGSDSLDNPSAVE